MLKYGIARHGIYRPSNEQMLTHKAIEDTAPITPTDYGAVEGLTNKFTAHIEFNDADFQSIGASETILFIGASETTFFDYIQIYKRNSGSNDRLDLRIRSGNTDTVWVSAFLLASLPGHHKITLDVSPGRVVMYMDGFKIFDRDTAYTFPTSLADGVNIGRANNGGTPFAGEITKFEFYTASALEIAGESWLRNKSRNDAIIPGKTFNSELNIIAFLGQSNSCGQATGAPVYSNSASMKMIRNTLEIENYSDPFDDATGSLMPTLNDTNPALGHAGFMLDEILSAQEGLYAAAPLSIAGTSMSGHWGQDLSLALFNQGGTTGTKHAGTVLTSVIQGLITLKTLGMLRAIIFHQGESDASDGVSQNAYQDYLERCFNTIWGALGNVPVILNTLHAYNASTGATESNWNAIIAAQIAWADTKDNVFLNNLSDIAAPNVHLDATGQQEAGERAAALYLENIL